MKKKSGNAGRSQWTPDAPEEQQMNRWFDAALTNQKPVRVAGNGHQAEGVEGVEGVAVGGVSAPQLNYNDQLATIESTASTNSIPSIISITRVRPRFKRNEGRSD